MIDYNEAQKCAITHVSGPMLTLAGPGSGKTTVITERVKYLITKAGIDPVHILVITFTKAAAVEMQTRFYRKMQGKHPPCTFGTFHSVFFMMLRAAYHYTSSNVLMEDQKYQILREIVSHMDIEYEDLEDFLHAVTGEISELKSEMIHLSNYHSKSCADEVFADIYRQYVTRLSGLHKIDFDDMLVYCYELLSARPDILKNWQNRFQYILIDEFQDINPIQYEIVKLLSAPRNNLFIVGDDDQSIYRFRGARPEIMLGFGRDYPDAHRVLLNVNYRCSRDICEAAARVIAHNENRYEKEIIAENDYAFPVRVHRIQTRNEEYLHMIRQIKQYKEQGIAYEQMAVLYRTNIQPRTLVGQLMAYNIPFQMRDVLPSLYQHFTVQHVLTYIRIALGDDSRAGFLTIINKPKRYISRDAFTSEHVSIDALKEYYEEKQWALDYLDQLEQDLSVIRTMTPYAAVTFIRKAIGYDAYLREYADYRKIKVDELYAVLDELSEQVRPYRTYEQMFDGIAAYEEDLAKRRQETRKQHTGITLSTMHSAKGLEYDAVFVIEANEGYTPHKKSVMPEELEEERRMFYVAMTRARKYLHLYCVAEIFGKPVEPSRFIGELLVDQAGLSVGSKVVHKQFGTGEVAFLNQDRISICFENTGETKTFRKEYLFNKQLLTTV